MNTYSSGRKFTVVDLKIFSILNRNSRIIELTLLNHAINTGIKTNYPPPANVNPKNTKAEIKRKVLDLPEGHDA